MQECKKEVFIVCVVLLLALVTSHATDYLLEKEFNAYSLERKNTQFIKLKVD